jgi:hypothetical protein
VSSWTVVRRPTSRIPLTGLSKQTPALIVLSRSGWRQVRSQHHTCLHDVHALEVAKQDLRPYFCLKVLLERGCDGGVRGVMGRGDTGCDVAGRGVEDDGEEKDGTRAEVVESVDRGVQETRVVG